MDKNNQIASNNEDQDEIIVLGVASVDTHGPGAGGEADGVFILPGISKE